MGGFKTLKKERKKSSLIYSDRVKGWSTIQMSQSWRANTFSQCDFYLPFTPFVQNDRILKETLIIFTAHSIIPAKRLINDLPQWACRKEVCCCEL